MAFTRQMQSAGGKIGGRVNALRYNRVGNRAWGLSMKNKRGGNILFAHNPKHCHDLHLLSPHVIAKRLRDGQS